MPSGVGEGKSFIISSLFRLSGLLHRGGLSLSWLLICAHIMICWRVSQASSAHTPLGLLNPTPEYCTNGQNYQGVGGLQTPPASNSLVRAQQWARGRCNLSLSSKRKRVFMLHFLFSLSCGSLDMFFQKLSFWASIRLKAKLLERSNGRKGWRGCTLQNYRISWTLLLAGWIIMFVDVTFLSWKLWFSCTFFSNMLSVIIIHR